VLGLQIISPGGVKAVAGPGRCTAGAPARGGRGDSHGLRARIIRAEVIAADDDFLASREKRGQRRRASWGEGKGNIVKGAL